jgi:hypothetical protein
MPDFMKYSVVLVATLLPGAAMIAWTRPATSRAGALGATLALSPIVGGALVALGVSAGLSWAGALWALLGLAALAIALGAARGAFASWRVSAPGARAAWISAALGVLVLGGMFAASEWWQLYGDAWTHEPIVRALLTHGVPPPDPWYAGFRLQYAWLYHAWVAALVAATGLSTFGIMSYLAVVSFAALALVAGDLAGRLHPHAAGWTTAFVLLGMNGAFVFTLPVIAGQALFGASGSPALFAQAFDGVTRNADRAGDLLRWFGAQTWFGNKFAGATPLSLGLAALTAWLAALWRVLDTTTPRRRDLVLLGACAACAGLMHPVLLLFLGVTTTLWWVASPLAGAGDPHASFVHATRPALATAASLVIPAAYFAGILAPSAGHLAPPFDLSAAKLTGLSLSVLPALVCAGLGARAFVAWGQAPRLWLLWTLAAALFTVALRLPGTWAFFTVDKTSYLAWIPLALVGGGAFATLLGRLPRGARFALAALVLVPPTGLALGARVLDPRFAWRQPWQEPGMARLRAELPADALLIVPPGDIDTPIFLARDAFDEEKIDGFVRGYDPDELIARRALVDSLYRAGVVSQVLLDRLTEFGRPVYAVWPDQAGPAWQARTPGVPQRLFRAEGRMPPFAGSGWKTFGDSYAVLTLVPPRGRM